MKRDAYIRILDRHPENAWSNRQLLWERDRMDDIIKKLKSLLNHKK